MIPCTAFNLNNELEVKACFHYTNLQPLWAADNIQKHGNYIKEDKEKYMKEYLEKYSNIEELEYDSEDNSEDELEYDSEDKLEDNSEDELEYDSEDELEDNLDEISNESKIFFLENKLTNNLIYIQS
jgi:hypothetical protein